MSGPMSLSRRRRLRMGAVLLATVLFTLLALRLTMSSSTTGSSSGSSSGGTTLTGGTAHDVVTLTIASPKTGTTAVEVRLTPREGIRATGSATAVTVSAVLPTAGHAVPDYAAVRTANNRYQVASLPLMMTGRWEFLVDIDGQGRHDHLVFPLTLTR
ncbi:hypothetical protein AB0M32_11585 [Streptomyces sp. NPDC051985]|uniref:hypothetical protein n=1 Tax=Streptomyces sp. NPDC051985 TaxID=3155807 RepID=UPI0034286D99